MEIYRYFQGRSARLLEVKRWILINSPFAFHSRALGLLEKEGLLTVNSNGDVRRSGNFRANDFSEGNNWQLSFHEVPRAGPLHHSPEGGSGSRTPPSSPSHEKRGPAALLSNGAQALPATPALVKTHLFNWAGTPATPAPAVTQAPEATAPSDSPAVAPASAQKMKVTRVTCELCGQKEVNKKTIRTHQKSAKCKKLTQLRAVTKRLFQ